jgi:DNA-binding NarL/FixJ family response regulator
MPSRTTSSDAGYERIRVLVVDDNPAMLARAASVLTATCVVVGQVRDGVSALAAAATLVPDVVVLDISMPGMSGLDVAAGLRAAGSTAAIVFLTVHEDPELVEAAQAAGGIGYVVKSQLASDLPHAVHEARARRPFVSLPR